ncbi:MAG: PD-(D/E)XK nuclease family protein [Chloroflexi bacterium]|nr:PD-(D/E)XK nuclease family protein [Chloroflexota bacterium]
MSAAANHLPAGFQLSQHSLSTYQRCKRRFWLRYVQRQPWPMAEGEQPLEYQQHLQRGVIFHRWLERAQLGLPVDLQVNATDDPLLQSWWSAWKSFDYALLPHEVLLSEYPLTIGLGAYRLYARYDLIALQREGRAVIVDWKTLQAVPSLKTLRTRLQTRIYCYMLACAGNILTQGAPVAPERIEMCYWFANEPEATVYIPYSRANLEDDRVLLTELAEEIAGAPEEAFTKTERQEYCITCAYRTLCERAGTSGSPRAAEWLDEDVDFALDLERTPAVDW